MSLKIGGNGGLDVSKVLEDAMDPAQIAKKAIDPLNLFGGDKMGGVQGLFNGSKPGAPSMPGGDSIEDILAVLGGKKDKNNQFDTSSVANSLFSGGKDMGSAGAGDALGGIGSALKGITDALGPIMGMIKQVLPIVASFFGGF